MKGPNEQNGASGAGPYPDETIRRFLLRRLSAEERERFEERLFADEGLAERVRLAECELADDYACGRVSSQERAELEKEFFVTEGRRRLLLVSQDLRRRYASPAAAPTAQEAETGDRHGRWGGRLSLSGLNRPALIFAVSAAALILFAAAVWFAANNLRGEAGPPAVARRETQPAPTPQASERGETPTVPEATTFPNPIPGTAPKPAAPSLPATVLRVPLAPGALRDGGGMARITPPRGGRAVLRLQLTLESDEPGTYEAELLTAEGLHVSGARNLKARRSGSSVVLNFDVPARLVHPGDYQVKLDRRTGGQTENAGRYYFRASP